jgi:hypothetical protein
MRTQHRLHDRELRPERAMPWVGWELGKKHSRLGWLTEFLDWVGLGRKYLLRWMGLVWVGFQPISRAMHVVELESWLWQWNLRYPSNSHATMAVFGGILKHIVPYKLVTRSLFQKELQILVQNLNQKNAFRSHKSSKILRMSWFQDEQISGRAAEIISFFLVLPCFTLVTYKPNGNITIIVVARLIR